MTSTNAMEKFTVFLIATTCLLLLHPTMTSGASPERPNYTSLNISCPPLDSCSGFDSLPSIQKGLDNRTCACDQQCTVYDDCCVDGPVATPSTINPYFKCVELHRNDTIEGVFMISSCPRNWKGDPMVVQSCEGSQNDLDPVGNLPLTDTKSNVTYKNAHCAICHDRSDTWRLALWKLRLEFNSVTEEEFNEAKLVYKDNSWGFDLERGGNHYFPETTINLVLPEELKLNVRFCKPNLTRDCASNWTDEDVKRKCQAYHGAMENKGRTPLFFRNVHCAICNHADLSVVDCYTPKPSIQQRALIRPLSVLLDITGNDNFGVGLKVMCPERQIYDRFFRRCRSLSCFRPEQVVKDGKCVTLEKVSFPTDPVPTVTTQEVTVPPPNPTTLKPEITSRESGTTLEPEVTTTLKLKISTQEHSTTLKPELKTDVFTSKVTEGSRTIIEYDIPKRNSSSTPPYSPEFVSCPQVYLSAEDFDRLANGSVRISAYNRVYDSGDFRLWNNGVFVCAPKDFSRLVNKFSPALGYVTSVCLILSIVCLFVHLVVFVSRPQWRNLSSKNLASLSASLLLAFLGFLVAQIDNLPKEACIFLAAEMVYFFLAAFFWMNVMAFDVWRTLRMATRELRVNNGRQCCRYFLYSIYGWFIPAGVVCAALILDQTDTLDSTSEYRPGFGVHWCWFSSRKALLVFFAVPLMAVMVANAVFFISSARMIESTTEGTHKHSGRAGNDRRNFRLYWKLAVMLGFAWSFGLAASYLKLETLWYVFVVFNALQGVFIFVAFTCCNGKVKKYLSERMELLRRRRAYHTSSLNSGSAFNSNSTEPSSNPGFKTSSTDLKSKSVSSF